MPFKVLREKYKRIFFVLDNPDNDISEIKTPYTIQGINGFKVVKFDARFLNEDYLNMFKFWTANIFHQEVYHANLKCPWMPVK